MVTTKALVGPMQSRKVNQDSPRSTEPAMFTPTHVDKNLTPSQLRERIAERERERETTKAERSATPWMRNCAGCVRGWPSCRVADQSEP